MTTENHSFEELFPDAKAGDKIKSHSLLVTETPKECVECGEPTRFIEWCTESPLCSEGCYHMHFEKINRACNEGG